MSPLRLSVLYVYVYCTVLSHLVAHNVTAVLRTTCLQLKPSGPAVPLKALSKLGKAGTGAPRARAAALALIAGMNKLRAVHDIYVNEPERS